MSDLANVARLVIFITFVVLGLRIRGREDRTRQFVLFVLAITLLTGFTQREAWPFTHWALFHHLAPERFSGLTVQLVDADGAIHPSDARMWQPVGEEEIDSWLSLRFDRLDDAQRARLAAWILKRAEERRGKAAANGWLLGPLAAPYHFLHRSVWNDATPPFRGVRIVRVRLNPTEEELLYAFPPR